MLNFLKIFQKIKMILFLIYINDLPDGITSMCKTFVDDTSLFSKVLDISKSVTDTDLNTDLYFLP